MNWGPRILAGGSSGLLDFILRALQALRPCDPRNDALDSEQTLVLVLFVVVVILLLVVVLLVLGYFMGGWVTGKSDLWVG